MLYSGFIDLSVSFMVMPQTNVANVPHKLVVTCDGRTVEHYSEDWRLCCEAVYVIGLCPQSERDQYIKSLEVKRKAPQDALREEIKKIEHAYVLMLETKDLRRSYLAEFERLHGKAQREQLEARVVALWNSNKKKVVE